MPFKLKVYGKASQKFVNELLCLPETNDHDLLNFLRSSNIPIASSCDGDGVCKKCVVNHDVLTCQINVKNFYEQYGDTIQVDYL